MPEMITEIDNIHLMKEDITLMCITCGLRCAPWCLVCPWNYVWMLVLDTYDRRQG